jgi:hypothetical protein
MVRQCTKRCLSVFRWKFSELGHARIGPVSSCPFRGSSLTAIDQAKLGGRLFCAARLPNVSRTLTNVLLLRHTLCGDYGAVTVSLPLASTMSLLVVAPVWPEVLLLSAISQT